MVEHITYGLIFISLYVQIFFLLAVFEHSSRRKPKATPVIADADLPSATIVVPCWNEEKTVGGTIESLLKLDYPVDKLKIVVVDDGSTDNTYEIAAQYASDPRVSIIRKKNGGKFTAMNLALANTDTDLFGALDADSFVAPDALRNAVKYFTDGVHAVTPAMGVANGKKNLLTLMQRAEYALGMAVKYAYSTQNALFVTPGPFSLFRTKTARELGGWIHAHGTEDCEIALRMQSRKLRIVNGPDVFVYTTVPRNVYRLYKQRVRWTYGFLMNALSYRQLFFNRSHGPLGMLVLPTMVFMTAGALYAYALILWHAGSGIGKWLIRIYDTGIHQPKLVIDWFFIDTSPIAVLAVVLFTITLTFMVMGKRILKQKLHSPDAIFYFLIYGFIAPVWLGAALIRAIAGKQAPWR